MFNENEEAQGTEETPVEEGANDLPESTSTPVEGEEGSEESADESVA